MSDESSKKDRFLEEVITAGAEAGLKAVAASSGMDPAGPEAAMLAKAGGKLVGRGASVAVEHAKKLALSLFSDPVAKRLRELELEAASEALEAKVEERLEDAPNEEEAAHVFSAVEATARSWSEAQAHVADGKKRRLLLAALVHAFDRESYEEGLSLRVMQTLERLDYAAVRLLRDLEIDLPSGRRLPTTDRSLTLFHAQQLVGEGLALRFEPGSSIRTFVCTEFGQVLLRYVREQLQADLAREAAAGT
ncbi:MAG: hypothetical protein H6720_30065 [Sandaracinus sp.]|nr:hypothetical protein [Sandaracinus sp.]